MRTDLRHRLQTQQGKHISSLRRYLTASAVSASNWIEGFKVSAIDVEDLIAGEHDIDVTELNRAETLAYERMMTYLQTLADADDFEYSTGQLNAMHWMLQRHRHSPRKPAGRWRRKPVYVTDAENPRVAAYTAPDVDRVPDLMAEFVGWLNAPDDTHPLIRAAMAHLQLVSIHPWADGNGRMSRSLQTLLIAREGILAPEFSCIEAWLGEFMHQWEYYRVLGRRGRVYRPEQDVSEWIRFNLVAYHQRAQMAHFHWTRFEHVWALVEEFAASRKLPERIVTALHAVAMSDRVRRSRYAQVEGLSPQQAQRDLRDLVSLGIVEAVGRARPRYYVAGPYFPDTILDIAHRPTTLSDPFAA